MRPTPEQLQTALTVADQSRPPHYVAVLAAEVRALQRELDLFRSASEAAELRIVELREELSKARDDFHDADQAAIARSAEIDALRAAIARVEALCSMNHDDSLRRVGDIRAALRDVP